ncbi:hypothetical protein HMPREF0658_0174 [Hoylesella marshii DSM 16973 = JCM 13450]|uniref:Uncharacterized protein n=1 Tax=Hoylesella marshii DSM 16973 = JCM 13450 TaxID=862515 RepID=E0NPS3_9BACT|nr:hypothetical protein HMPREF0658_0174 [Hoylesella marshii DSM 16973 = JCM 13450]
MPFTVRKVADLSLYKRHLYQTRMPTYPSNENYSFQQGTYPMG